MWKLPAALLGCAAVGLIVAGAVWLVMGRIGTAGLLGTMGLGFVGLFAAAALWEWAGRGWPRPCSVCRQVAYGPRAKWAGERFVCAACRRR
jgi:hypothetical protein